jgi:serine/threonine protein kinase
MIVTCPLAGCGRKFRAPKGWLGRHVEAPCGHTLVVGVPDTTLPDTTPEEPAPGSVLGGKYLLRRLLGRGGMGVVYEAWDQLLGRTVAVKLLPAGGWQDPRARQRFLAEAVAAGRVQHPKVVTTYDCADPDDGPPYLVMEYLPGGTVARLLRARGGLSPRQATRMAADACRALGAVHRAGLIHRDVKPANLLLSARGGVKLADFGLAIAVGPDGQAEPPGVAGPPGYLSPEQAWGLPLDRRTDLYSLGLVYYEMLTGRKLVRAATLRDSVRFHRDNPAADPRADNPALPSVCAAVVRRALARDPSERYPDAGAMRAALRTALSHSEVRGT